MKFYCIADEDTVRGFRLAGVAGEAVTTAVQAATALAGAVARADCGVVVLTERVAADLHAEVEAIRWDRERPLVVVIAGPEGTLPGRKSLRQIANEAVGIRVGGV